MQTWKGGCKQKEVPRVEVEDGQAQILQMWKVAKYCAKGLEFVPCVERVVYLDRDQGRGELPDIGSQLITKHTR